MSVVDELMWDALQEGATKAAELGLYGPGQDLVADALHRQPARRGPGHGGAAVPGAQGESLADRAPLVRRQDGAHGVQLLRHRRLHAARGFNTGLVIAASKMKRGYLIGDGRPSTPRPRRSRPVPIRATRRPSTTRWKSSPRGLQEKGHHAARARGPLRHRRADARLALRHRPHLEPEREGRGGSARLHLLGGAAAQHQDQEGLHLRRQGRSRCSWPSPRATGRRPGRSPRRGPPRPWWPATAAAATTCTSCPCRSTRRRPSGRDRSCPAVTLSCNIHTRSHRRDLGSVRTRHAVGRGAAHAPPSWPSSSATRTASSSRRPCTRTSSSTRRAGRSGAPASERQFDDQAARSPSATATRHG